MEVDREQQDAPDWVALRDMQDNLRRAQDMTHLCWMAAHCENEGDEGANALRHGLSLLEDDLTGLRNTLRRIRREEAHA